jgi:alpha-1,2-mannosyltransferase
MRRAVLVLLVVAGGVAGWLAADRLTDLAPYRYGGRAVLHGLALYDAHDPVSGLPFTYPPFGAVAMVPLAVLPVVVAGALVTAVSVAALAAVVRTTLPVAAAPLLVVALALGSLALEPVWQTLRFGQVNLLLILVVIVELVRPERRLSGVLVGLVAGIKLTPLVFVVLLLMVGRRDAALRATAVFGATVAVGFALMPGQAASYWGDRLLDGTRVGPPELAHNQSVYGALSRLLGEPPPTALWLVAAAPLAGAALVVAAVWWRRGDRVLGTGMAALAMLLASPVSWSHHWVWAVPLALAVWPHSRAVAVAWTAVFVIRPILWPPWGQGREHDWGAVDHLVGNSYLLAAAGLVVWAASVALRSSTAAAVADEGPVAVVRDPQPVTIPGVPLLLPRGPLALRPRVGDVSDEDIQARIKGLIEQEHDLRQRLGAGAISSEVEHSDLARIEVELDQCWDLLRQRRARREYGQDPDEAAVRDAGTVENYQG